MPFDDTPNEGHGNGGDGGKRHDPAFLGRMSQLLQSKMLGTIDEHGGCHTCTMVGTAIDILARAVLLNSDNDETREECIDDIVNDLRITIETAEANKKLLVGLEKLLAALVKRDDEDNDPIR